MFDGSLFIEMIRARILLEFAESKPWRRALGRVGNVLIAAGQWLKSRAKTLPPAHAPVESWKHRQ